MKAKIVSVFLAVLLFGLCLPGCASKAELDECRALVAEKDTEISELEKENLELQKEIDRLSEKEIDRLSETAKIEITFDPDPVPCKNGKWSWKAILTETNGVGVKLTGLTKKYIQYDRYVVQEHGSSIIEEWCGSTYLPAGGSLYCSRLLYYEPGVYQETIVFTGIDDNGHEITAENIVKLLSP